MTGGEPPYAARLKTAIRLRIDFCLMPADSALDSPDPAIDFS